MMLRVVIIIAVWIALALVVAATMAKTFRIQRARKR
jgi:hypothetical protein